MSDAGETTGVLEAVPQPHKHVCAHPFKPGLFLAEVLVVAAKLVGNGEALVRWLGPGVVLAEHHLKGSYMHAWPGEGPQCRLLEEGQHSPACSTAQQVIQLQLRVLFVRELLLCTQHTQMPGDQLVVQALGVWSTVAGRHVLINSSNDNVFQLQAQQPTRCEGARDSASHAKAQQSAF